MLAYPCTFLISLAQVNQNETTVWQAVNLNVFGLIIAELIFYIQSKTQAKLYLSLKVTESQQNQLQNLLDNMPDEVLIVSRGSDEKSTKAVYSNK